MVDVPFVEDEAAEVQTIDEDELDAVEKLPSERDRAEEEPVDIDRAAVRRAGRDVSRNRAK